MAQLEAIAVTDARAADPHAVSQRAVLRIEIDEVPSAVDAVELCVASRHAVVGDRDGENALLPDAGGPLLAPAEPHFGRLGEPVARRSRQRPIALDLQIQVRGKAARTGLRTPAVRSGVGQSSHAVSIHEYVRTQMARHARETIN